MNKPLHTPAPWKHDSTWGLIKHGKSEICALHSGNIANAHLISAAPDLLDALQACLDYFLLDSMMEEDATPEIEKIKNAIAKAKGEA